jgi:hypothetical protein
LWLAADKPAPAGPTHCAPVRGGEQQWAAGMAAVGSSGNNRRSQCDVRVVGAR